MKIKLLKRIDFYFRHNSSARLSTGEDQALYSYPFGMEDDYKDFKVKKKKNNFWISMDFCIFFLF
jgi:hypothetical protein